MEKTMPQSDDEQYVLKAQQGDQDALEYLLKKYHNLAHYIALKLCHCDADAEDIVQESFIEIQKSIRNLQEPRYFKAWLNKIIFSKSTKLFRKNKDVNMSDQESLQLSRKAEERRYFLPEKEMRFQEDKQILLDLLDQLPEKLRVTVYLMYFEQMSVKEIAMALDIPDGTVKSRISSAKKELQARITAYEEKEHARLDFRESTLEAMLVALLAKEYELVMSGTASTAPTTMKTSKFSRVIQPTTLAVIGMCTLCAVSAGYAIYQNMKATESKTPLVTTVGNEQDHTFEPLTFQGKVLHNAKEAHVALISTAHCHVEIAELDLETQNEIKKVYQALKKNGGVYYELLHNRDYADNFE